MTFPWDRPVPNIPGSYSISNERFIRLLTIFGPLLTFSSPCSKRRVLLVDCAEILGLFSGQITQIERHGPS
jgi:hypothetical protein